MGKHPWESRRRADSSAEDRLGSRLNKPLAVAQVICNAPASRGAAKEFNFRSVSSSLVLRVCPAMAATFDADGGICAPALARVVARGVVVVPYAAMDQVEFNHRDDIEIRERRRRVRTQANGAERIAWQRARDRVVGHYCLGPACADLPLGWVG